MTSRIVQTTELSIIYSTKEDTIQGLIHLVGSNLSNLVYSKFNNPIYFFKQTFDIKNMETGESRVSVFEVCVYRKTW